MACCRFLDMDHLLVYNPTASCLISLSEPIILVGKSIRCRGVVICMPNSTSRSWFNTDITLTRNVKWSCEATATTASQPVKEAQGACLHMVSSGGVWMQPWRGLSHQAMAAASLAEAGAVLTPERYRLQHRCCSSIHRHTRPSHRVEWSFTLQDRAGPLQASQQTVRVLTRHTATNTTLEPCQRPHVRTSGHIRGWLHSN